MLLSAQTFDRTYSKSVVRDSYTFNHISRTDERRQTSKIKQRCGSLCRKLPDNVLFLVFRSQINIERIYATFQLVNKIKMKGMLFNGVLRALKPFHSIKYVFQTCICIFISRADLDVLKSLLLSSGSKLKFIHSFIHSLFAIHTQFYKARWK